ncbi:hypothetical protein EON80_00645 [bacterium]|nr:MAG: hypothetical protein EON80_00645 [bacterium]
MPRTIRSWKTRAIIIGVLLALVYRFYDSRRSFAGQDLELGVQIWSLAWSPDDKNLLVSSVRNSMQDDHFHWYNGGVQVYDSTTRRVIQSLPYVASPNPNVFPDAGYSADGKRILMEGYDDSFKGTMAFDAKTFAKLGPSKEWLARGKVRLESPNVLAALAAAGSNGAAAENDNTSPNRNTYAALSHDNKTIAVGNASGKVRFLTVEEFQSRFQTAKH